MSWLRYKNHYTGITYYTIYSRSLYTREYVTNCKTSKIIYTTGLQEC